MKRKAFTLIELLVVISIIALLAGIMLPVFRHIHDRNQSEVIVDRGSHAGPIVGWKPNDQYTLWVMTDGWEFYIPNLPAKATMQAGLREAIRTGDRVEIEYVQKSGVKPEAIRANIIDAKGSITTKQ